MGLDSRRVIDTVHPDLTCTICLDILSLDCLADENEHIYCKKCISDWFDKGNRKCPIGNEMISLRLMKVPRIAKNLLSDIRVYCAFQDKGCEQMVKYENLEKHEKECNFNCKECQKGCGIVIKSSEINSHDCIKELRLKIQDLMININELTNENVELNEKMKNSQNCQYCNPCNSITLQKSSKAESGFINFFKNFKKPKSTGAKTTTAFYPSRSCDNLILEFPYNSIKSFIVYKISCEQLVSMALSLNAKQILVIDAKEDSLKILDNKGKLLNTNNLNGLVKTPISLCTNMLKTELFIASYENAEICVFDMSFNLKKKICKNKINKPCCITVDNEVLYIGDWDENCLTIWNLKNDEKVSTFKVDSPVAIRTSFDKLYVLSRTEAKFDSITKKFEKLETGSNCVFVYDKIKYNLLNKLMLSNWVSPAGLYIDTKNSYIYTIAYELDKNQLRSQSRYLFVLNNKSEIVKKLYLDGIQYISDMIVYDNSLIFCIHNSIKIIELQ